MTAKTSAARRAAFLRALAATGNQTLAAERARVSRRWVQLHRARDPAFAQAVEDALRAARERLADRGGIAPPKGWAALDGAELVVRGTNGRRVQVARAGPREFSPRLEARFLSVLAGTCNVKVACADIGMTPAAVYAHRKRRNDFARRWDEAVDFGYVLLETGLLERCGSLFADEEVTPDLDMPPPTAKEALQLLYLYRHRVHGIGKPMRQATYAGVEETREAIFRKIDMIKRGRDMDAREMARARRDWAAVREGRKEEEK